MTERPIFNNVTDPQVLTWIKEFGTAIGKSGLIGLPSVEAGQLIAFELLIRKMSFQEFTSIYQVTFGKLTMRAEAMLAEFVRRGGDYKILSMTPEVAAIELFREGVSVGTFKVTHDEIRQEPFYGKNPKYKTPFSRQAMLWARVASLGIRMTDPSVNSGLYTPEESQDIALEDGKAEADPAPKDDPPIPTETVADIEAKLDGEQAAPLPDTTPATTAEAAVPEGIVLPRMAHEGQLNKLQELLVSVYPNESAEALQNALDNRGYRTIADFTHNEAEGLISKLSTAVRNQTADDDVPF